MTTAAEARVAGVTTVWPITSRCRFSSPETEPVVNGMPPLRGRPQRVPPQPGVRDCGLAMGGLARWRNGYALSPARLIQPGSTPGWASTLFGDPGACDLRPPPRMPVDFSILPVVTSRRSVWRNAGEWRPGSAWCGRRMAGETRVALTPDAVKKLIALGFTVTVQSGRRRGRSLSGRRLCRRRRRHRPRPLRRDDRRRRGARGARAPGRGPERPEARASWWRPCSTRTWSARRWTGWPAPRRPASPWSSCRASAAPSPWTCCRPRRTLRAIAR